VGWLAAGWGRQHRSRLQQCSCQLQAGAPALEARAGAGPAGGRRGAESRAARWRVGWWPAGAQSGRDGGEAGEPLAAGAATGSAESACTGMARATVSVEVVAARAHWSVASRRSYSGRRCRLRTLKPLHLVSHPFNDQMECILLCVPRDKSHIS
jgi:hypothetical protein